MRITGVEELSKSRSRVYIDQEFAFVLYKSELKRCHINAGEELATEDYREIMDEILPKRAKLRAMNLLTSREYTTAQLRAKLQQGLYPDSVIDIALEYVASFHYTDDLRFAAAYIEGHADSRSRRRIEQDLLRRGISNDVMQTAWTNWEEQGGGQDEEQMIREHLRKRHFDFEKADYKERQKQASFLMRKGFRAESIRHVLT